MIKGLKSKSGSLLFADVNMIKGLQSTPGNLLFADVNLLLNVLHE